METKNAAQSNDIQTSEKFPIHESISENNIETLSKLCKNIKSENIHMIDGFDSSGNTPLIYAIQKQNEDIIDLLLQSGANPNKLNAQGETPLTTSIKHFSSNIINMLIEEGANVNQTNSQGDSPLKIATSLKNQECITLLTEHGASFSKKHAHTSVADSSNSALDYKNSLLDLIKSHQKNKNAIDSLEKFNTKVLRITTIYLGKKLTLKNKSHLERVFNQLLEINKKSSEKEILNLIRKTISAINDGLKEELLKSGDTNSIHKMSKAESVAEEEITKIKEINDTPRPQEIKTNIAPIKESQNKNTITQEFYEKIHESQGLFETIKENILCRTTNHDVVLSETNTIKPHHPRTPEEARRILTITKQRLTEDRSLTKDSVKTQMKEIQKIIDSSEKEKRNITNNEGALIDKILRPGKSERIHILHFPSNTIKNSTKDLSIEALETGATIHHFKYHDNAQNKNDLVFAGIANVNKLLDEGVHPDRIILQGVGPEGEIARCTAMQFAKRQIYLTQIYINCDIISKSNHRQFSLTEPLKAEKDTPVPMKEFINSFEKTLKKNSKDFVTTNVLMFASNKTWLSLSQRANLFIKAMQNFLHTESKYRNAHLPKERVENIIGTNDVDENQLGS